MFHQHLLLVIGLLTVVELQILVVRSELFSGFFGGVLSHDYASHVLRVDLSADVGFKDGFETEELVHVMLTWARIKKAC